MHPFLLALALVLTRHEPISFNGLINDISSVARESMIDKRDIFKKYATGKELTSAFIEQ